MNTVVEYGIKQADAHVRRKSIVGKFVIFMSGIFLTFGAYTTLLYLQSSVNIENGVGAAASTAIYVTAAVFGVIFTPLVMRAFGTKSTLIICHITYLIYIAANFYPKSYTLIPGGVIVGMGEATMWPTMMMFCVHYARRYARYGRNNPDFYVTEFIGYFFFVFQLCQVFGNLISYAILYGGKTPITHNSSIPSDTIQPGLLVCGPNDCQNPNITELNIDQYVPAGQTTLFIVYGVMGGMVLIAIGVHLLFVRKIDSTLEAKDPEDRFESKKRGVDNATINITEPDSCKVSEGFDVNRNGTLKKEIEIEYFSRSKPNTNADELATTTTSSDFGDVISRVFSDMDSELENDKKSYIELAVSIVKRTVLHLISPKQLLIIPFSLYSGIYSSFVFSELTRAFTSCILGVDQVGLCMAIFCGINALVSFFIGKISSRIGRNFPLAVGFLLDIGNYMFCLFWIPTESTTWIVYLIFFSFGLTDGIWNPLVNDMHASYFPDKQEVAFTVWNLCVLSGFAIQFGWSTTLCVRHKVFIQLAILCFAIICYGFAEFVCSSQKSEFRNTLTTQSDEKRLQLPDPFSQTRSRISETPDGSNGKHLEHSTKL